MVENGVRIKNIEAGSLYEMNNGARDSFRYTNAILTNSLFLDFLMSHGLKIWKGTMTRDIIGLDFEMGSRSFAEEIDHLESTRKRYEAMGEEGRATVEKLDGLISAAKADPSRYVKKSSDDIRTEFYRDGVNVTYITRDKSGAVKKVETIHYKMLFRSTGKAKKGSCMFICDRLYDRALKFLRMGIELPQGSAPIVQISAYSPLISSSIVGKIKIDPANIFIMRDSTSDFVTKVVSIETDANNHCIAKPIDNYTLTNTMFDGQALIDKSIFPTWGNGYVLLRHHFCKMAAFSTNIQDYFRDVYSEAYETAQIEDMFGVQHFVKDIKLITTESAMKWLNFDVSYEYWCDRVRENGCEFGVVKTAHRSKLGEVQRMSYQMVNALDESIMPNAVKNSVDYINALKSNDDVFLDYLSKNVNFTNDYDVLVALVEQDRAFLQSEYFRQRRKHIIEAYVLNFKSGHINQNGDNLVIVGSPYAMLMSAVGLDPEDDPTFVNEFDAIQCYTERFDDGVYLAEFRSPFNSKNNLGYLHNNRDWRIAKYFNFGELVIAVNMRHTDFQDRNNGSDQDSDMIYCTDQIDIVGHAKRCYQEYPTIVNNIPKESKSYENTPEMFAQMDNDLAAAQRAIGESSNLAQIALTYCYNFPDQKYKDYVCILSVLAQVAIDSAKRRFSIDLVDEIKRIKANMDIKEHGYPSFWGVVKKNFNRANIDPVLTCPMNYLYDTKFTKYRSELPTLPMSAFFVKYELQDDRRKCKKVEELIQRYSFNLYQSDYTNSESDWILARDDFDKLLNDIRQVYLSKNYLGLMSWLIDRAFCVTSYQEAKQRANITVTQLNKNRVALIKTLYTINPKCFLQIFRKRVDGNAERD